MFTKKQFYVILTSMKTYHLINFNGEVLLITDMIDNDQHYLDYKKAIILKNYNSNNDTSWNVYFYKKDIIASSDYMEELDERAMLEIL